MTAHAIYYLRCKCGGSFEGWRGQQYFSTEQTREAASKKGWMYKAPDIDICPNCLDNAHQSAIVEDYVRRHRVDGTFQETARLMHEYWEKKED